MRCTDGLRNRLRATLSIALGIGLFVRPALAGGRWGANYFPNAPLTTQDGATVHFYDDVLKGKIVAINLIYTRCRFSCPLETARLAQVQRLLGDRVGKDIFFYSISLDPEFDTPAVLKAYAQKFHAGPGWTFLTGKKEDIDLLSKKIGLYSDPALTKDGHMPHLLIGNEVTGEWMRDSATDNPKFLANLLGRFMSSGRNSASAQPGKSYAEAKPLDLGGPGRYLFIKQCVACHTIGHGDQIGPDLLGVTLLRDRAWLVRFIREPEQVLAEKDPIATALFQKYNQVHMPKLPLGNEDINALLEFMTAQDRASRSRSNAVVGARR